MQKERGTKARDEELAGKDYTHARMQHGAYAPRVWITRQGSGILVAPGKRRCGGKWQMHLKKKNLRPGRTVLVGRGSQPVNACSYSVYHCGPEEAWASSNTAAWANTNTDLARA